MEAAEAYALKNPGTTTLGQTRAGQNLQSLIDRLNVPWDGAGGAREMWARLSKVYAQGAKGPVHFFTGPTGYGPNSIWITTEKPILTSRGVIIKLH